MPETAAQLYERDFVRWVESQVEALRDAARSGTNLPLDWDHLIEEVDSLGRSQRHELRNRLATVIEHLIKLQHSSAVNPRAGWLNTVRRERRTIQRLLAGSPSLKSEIASMIAEEMRLTADDAAASLADYGEAREAVLAKTTAGYDADQVLGDWFPNRPDLDPPPP